MKILLIGNSHYIYRLLRRLLIWPPIEQHSLHVGDDRARIPIRDIREALRKHPGLEDTWHFTQQADGAIYAATPERHLYRRPELHLDLLRHDLMAAGRDPDRFPVVFDVLWMGYDDPLATEEQLEKVLRWPWSDRFDTQSSFSLAFRKPPAMTCPSHASSR